MFKKVLVGSDGRPGGRDAIALAGTLLDSDGEITLVRVFPGALTPSHAIIPGLVAEERERALQGVEKDRSDAGIEANVLACEGLSPGRVLHEVAEQEGADLLVLGSCRRGAFGRSLLGDDTRESLNGAPCAVAVAPGGYAERPAPFATIGVGYDGSSESRAALELARELAASTGARIRALQVLHFPTYIYTGIIPPVGEGIEEIVREADAEMKKLEGVDGKAEYGLPGEDLASFSREVDLMIVGSRSYGPIGRLIHGSTSNYLQRHARGPLLVLPRAAESHDAQTATEAERSTLAT